MFKETAPYLRLTHALWEQLMARGFSQQERRIVDLVVRLSWNCGRKDAYIPRQVDFEAAGIAENKIKAHLYRLIWARVIFREDGCYYRLNLDFKQWRIERTESFSPDKLARLVSLNLKGPDRRLPQKGSPHFPKREEKSSPKGKFLEAGTTPPEAGPVLPQEIAEEGSEKFPKREEKSSLLGKSPEAGLASAKERLKKGNYNNFKETEEIWGRVLGEMRSHVNAANYRTWLEGTAGLGFSKNDFVVGATESRIADYLNDNMRSLLEKNLIGVAQRGFRIAFRVTR